MNSLSNQPSISVFVENAPMCARVEGWPRRQAQGVAVGATGIVTPFGIPCSFFSYYTTRCNLIFDRSDDRAEGSPFLHFAFLGRPVSGVRVLPPYHTSHYPTAVDRGVRLHPSA